MTERKPKRQRFSLGGPSVDTSFEDYLTGKPTHVSSDEEEEFDQENVDPGAEEDDLEEDYDEDEEEEEPQPQPQPSKPTAPPAPRATITNPVDLVNKIHISQNLTKSSSAKNDFYLLQIRLLLPDVLVPITRLLRIPAILLFEQLAEALFAAFDWSGTHLWRFTLENRKPSAQVIHFQDPRKEIANIRDSGIKGMHNLGVAQDHKKDLDSKKIRLMEIWGKHQVEEVRRLKMFFTYDCYAAEPWEAAVTFMGVADEGLSAADMGIEVKKGQAVWCVGGTGAAMPETMPADEFEQWEDGNKQYEWDMPFVNSELEVVKVVDVSDYRHY